MHRESNFRLDFRISFSNINYVCPANNLETDSRIPNAKSDFLFIMFLISFWVSSMKLLFLSCTMCSLFFLSGCANTGVTGQRDRLTEGIDRFSAPPAGVGRLKVGVPPFESDPKNIYGLSVSGNELSELAADQMTTLLFKTNRFRVIERAQLNQLLREQNLEGIVKDGELARMGAVRGVDYLLLGKVTNFRIKREDTSTKYGVGGRISQSLFSGITGGFSQNASKVITEVGVDIRLVDPSTGEIMVAEFSEYERIETADALGYRVAGVVGSGDAKLSVGKDDAGQVLRLAFADALKKAIPQIDQVLIQRSTKE